LVDPGAEALAVHLGAAVAEAPVDALAPGGVRGVAVSQQLAEQNGVRAS
jgi:hypothetical protein